MVHSMFQWPPFRTTQAPFPRMNSILNAISKLPPPPADHESFQQKGCMAYAYDAEKFCSDEIDKKEEMKDAFKSHFGEACTETLMNKKCCIEKEICPVGAHIKFVYLGAPILATLLILLAIFGFWRVKKNKKAGMGRTSGTTGTSGTQGSGY